MVIRLHLNGEPIWVVAEQITHFTQSQGKAWISLVSGKGFAVDETPHELLEALTDGDRTSQIRHEASE